MGCLYVVAHQAKTVQGMAALVLATLLAVSLQSQQAGDAATLHGTVRDSAGKPVAAYVLLQAKGAPKPLTTYADSEGNYSLVNLRPGVYALHAERAGFVGAEIPTLFLSPKEVKTIDLTLAEQSASTKTPEFFDQPQFTVAGVTDTTSLGGHGSDTVVRTRETIAKDTASLGKTASSAPTVTETEKSLREKLVREPNSADLHHSLADLEEKLGNSLEAVREYQRAAELDPREPYLFDWGSELLLHHAPEPAVEVFSKGNRLFPHSVRMLVGLGAAWFARGDVDQAVKRVCTASDLNSDDSMPYLFLGKMQAAETIPPPELVEKLHRFATLQPENAEANYYYAVGLWKRRASPPDTNVATQVESLLNKAIRLDPKYSAAYLQLGIVDAEQRDSQRAIANYQRAIQADPQMEEAHYRLAQAYRQIGEADKAKAELQIYDQMSKESAENSERERHEIRQFVYTLRDPAPAQDH
jgi:tetratricopeptide (TPR) repeat protein